MPMSEQSSRPRSVAAKRNSHSNQTSTPERASHVSCDKQTPREVSRVKHLHPDRDIINIINQPNSGYPRIIDYFVTHGSLKVFSSSRMGTHGNVTIRDAYSGAMGTDNTDQQRKARYPTKYFKSEVMVDRARSYPPKLRHLH